MNYLSFPVNETQIPEGQLSQLLVVLEEKYSLSRSPKPVSYLFHVWSKSTEPSTLRWMTVDPPSM